MHPTFIQIPDKVYFRIGEVSELVGVETHVLRYWESEFALIKPRRGKSKQRLYRQDDVQVLLTIKDLLHNQGYTIAGAKKFLKLGHNAPQENTGLGSERHCGPASAVTLVEQIKHELVDILQYLGEGKIPKT
jgi:DNA-binding transcriptional MerR regulator